MTTTMLNRYNHSQHQMLLATLPTMGVLEYDLPEILSIIPAERLTGKVWRDSQRTKLDALKH